MLRAFAILLLLVWCTNAAQATEWSLVASGTSHATIVVGERATKVEHFAAEELQSYISQITGAKLPILAGTAEPSSTVEIFIGRPETNPRLAQLTKQTSLHLDRNTLGDDGYVVKTIASGTNVALVLTGSHERSSLFAVYHFLETCGVRFFGYKGRNGEIIPHTNALALPPPDIVEKPVMKYRFVSDNGYSPTDKTKLVNVADWAAKNRCNAFVLTPSRVGETWKNIALDEAQKRGLMIVGPGHILARLTPDKALFKSHPEYFPLLGGQRKSTYSDAWGGATAFCYSNPDAMHLVIANALKYLDAAPFIDVFALYPPDGSQRGVQCQCANCAKFTASDWYLTIMNNLARALESRTHAPKLMWISYNECGVTPKHVQPYANGKNFVLLWCNDLRVHNASMDSDANRHAAPYLQWKPRLKSIKTDAQKNPTATDLAAFHRWQKWRAFLQSNHYAGDVVLLEYYNAHVAKSLHVPMLGYVQSGPWPDGLMQKDFQFYTAQGISGWQNCTDYYNDSPTPYWNRLGARLMWNPSVDVAAIDHDFYQQLYGAAGPTVEKYFTTLWKEMAATDMSLVARDRVAALGELLKTADLIAAASENSLIEERLKSLHAFQDRCLKLKADEARDYHPDGSPKSVATDK